MAKIINGTLLHDRLRGTDRADEMNGFTGNDVFHGSGGADVINGGIGTDTVDYSDSPEAEIGYWGFDGVIVDLERGGLKNHAEGDTYSSIENVTGSAFGDALAGTDGANVILGGAGTDAIQGRGGADVLDGGTGWDFVSYAESDAAVKVDLLYNTAGGGHATGDTISGFEAIQGSDHNDRLAGNNDLNWLFGGDGDDRIYGRGGDDVIEGRADNDFLDGGANDDELSGGEGNDTLTGGTGADTFKFTQAYGGTDTVTDFEVGVDSIVIDIANADDPNGFHTGGNLSLGQIWIEYLAADGTIGKIVFEGVNSSQEANAIINSVEFI